MDPNGFILGTDTHEISHVPLAPRVDAFRRAVHATDPDYVPDLLRVCEREHIGMLIPLTDPEVDVLAGAAAAFGEIGTILAVARPRAVQTARDKLQLHDHFEDHPAVRVIPTILLSGADVKALPEPMLAKPRTGRNSEGQMVFHQAISAAHLVGQPGDLIAQPLLTGEVVTVDVVKDRHGHVACVPRYELKRTANGAGTTVRVTRDNEVEGLAATIVNELGLTGVSCIEFLKVSSAQLM